MATIRLTRISREGKAVRGKMRVNGRSGIRIHRGTKPEHSKGCVLVNAAMEQELTAKWLALQASKEPIKITIENEN